VSAAMVSTSSRLGLSPGRGHCVVFLGKTLAGNSHTRPIFSKVYKWVLTNLMLGVTLNGVASHPGGRKYP